MTLTIATETVGRRVYVVGNTFAIKQQLKDAGCKWDGDRKQWWIGTVKAKQIEAIVGKLDGQELAPPTKEELAERRCDGKVKYKGRDYYVIGRSQKTGKLWLTVLDCSIDFWAHGSECQWVKQYSPREDYRSGRLVYQTVGKIRDFIDRAKNDPSSIRPSSDHVRCRHCGDWTLEGDDWCTQCGKADYER